MLEVTMALCSECGERSANEDAASTGRSASRHFAVLSDGAGGHERGAEAARHVVDHVDAMLRAADGDFGPEPLTRVLLSAHAQLQHRQPGARGPSRMHATVVVLWIDGQRDLAVWSHIGDSRLYRLRYGALDLLTVDDSVVQQLLHKGMLTAEQAQNHPLKNQLLAAVGMQDAVDPHTVEHSVEIEDGDAYLLCSDGWWGSLTDADLLDSLAAVDTPAAWLEAMRGRILAQAVRGQDNFTAVAVWVSDPTQCTQSMDEAAADPEETVAAALSSA